MAKILHKVYLFVLVVAVLLLIGYLTYVGYTYYQLPLAERYYHPQYEWFKASGSFGHGLGVIGTLMILVGVVLYVTAKKYRYLERFIRLKYLLEFHIFLCTAGPIMILFHTTFKFGGVISIGFWSMALVVLSGIIGRYIYLQIPRTISGHELSLNDINQSQRERLQELLHNKKLSQEVYNRITEYYNPHAWGIRSYFYKRKQIQSIISNLKAEKTGSKVRREAIRILKREISMKLRIQRLEKMQQLFKYWHIAHRPFAIIMLVIVTIHVVITIMLGYRWLF